MVILSTADFDAEVWTNKQHLAHGLARRADVAYVESFGLRAPRLTRADVARVRRRLSGGGAPSSSAQRDVAPTRVEVIRPRVVPFHGSRAVRALNRRLVDRLDVRGLEDAVLWTFSPLTYGLESRARAVVYHSVDLLHTQPGVPAAALLEAEADLVGRADRVLASSTGVAQHLRELGAPEVRLWENVADTDLYSSVHAVREPRAVFAGNLTPTKIDAELMLAVVERGVPLAVAGPVQIDGTSVPPALRAVLAHPGVTYLGTLRPPELALELARSTVGLIPYVQNPYTAGVFPLKVHEYLAAGLAVVATELPSLMSTERPGVATVSRTGYAAAVEQAVHAFDAAEAAERSRWAGAHSWGARIDQAEELLRGL
ncbi:hypothetical protein Q760_15395 [Cellulomonas cellasea DSM 20118]|uniref:Glycosyl transferase n=1 Tax=Cellulomonas cellasea DSM 20118 TaxID=1408250 RepID=A0A0A0B5J4_9CELL|nr:hypothetical protein Q760_15395 [Cellulomonas cellasea DSM 20118]